MADRKPEIQIDLFQETSDGPFLEAKNEWDRVNRKAGGKYQIVKSRIDDDQKGIRPFYTYWSRK